MKVAGKILVGLMVLGVLMTYTGCKKKKGDPEPITDQQIEKLSKPWKVTKATLDGTDVKTKDYPNFTITLTGTKGTTSIGYTTTGRPALSPWASSGSFTFDATTPETKLTRDDTVPVTYSVSETALQISFQYNGKGFSRVGQVGGQWVFEFGQ
jgi:hypothetical protein